MRVLAARFEPLENRREVVKDPVTLRRHRGLYAGASGQLGVERFLKMLPSTSVEVSAGGDLALTRRDEQFRSGFNSRLLALYLRVGANYYLTKSSFQDQTFLNAVFDLIGPADA